MHLSSLVAPTPRNRREQQEQPSMPSPTATGIIVPSPVRVGTRAPPPSREGSIRNTTTMVDCDDDISNLTGPTTATNATPGVPTVMRAFEQLAVQEPTPLARLLSSKTPLAIAAATAPVRSTSKENHLDSPALRATATGNNNNNSSNALGFASTTSTNSPPRVLAPSHPNSNQASNGRNNHGEDNLGKIEDVQCILLKMQQQQEERNFGAARAKTTQSSGGDKVEFQWTPTNFDETKASSSNYEHDSTTATSSRTTSPTVASAADAPTNLQHDALSQLSLMSIVEAAVAHTKDSESQLAKLLLRAEDESAAGSETATCVLTVENVLEAAIQDMMSLQNTLLETECKLKLAQNQIDGEATGVPSTVGSSTEQDATSFEETTADGATHATDPQQNTTAAVAKLRQELAACQNEIQVLQGQRAKLKENVQKKKTALTTAAAANQSLQQKLATCTQEKEAIQAQLASVHVGLQKVSAVRDDCKAKLRLKVQQMKEIRAQKEHADRRLSSQQKERALERKLLDLYRELANQTGYNKMGKQLRMVEAELAAALADGDNEGNSNGTAAHHHHRQY